ncbi:MAG: cysteine desulfurase [Mycoplasma sp.]
MLNIKNQFPWFEKNPNTIYADSAATTLKPKLVIDTILEYLTQQSTNPHNSDSNFTFQAHQVMDECRKLTSELINCNEEEIIFTSGATESLNLIANALSDELIEGDEIVLTYYEHASNLLPWFKIRDDKKVIIKYAISEKFGLTAEDFLEQLTDKTKVVSFIGQSNLLGNVFPIKEIVKKIKEFNPNILVCVDIAQMIPHYKCDVKDWGVDFAAYSGHKIFSNSGIGVAFFKKCFQEKFRPLRFGGGMNTILKTDEFVYANKFEKFEAGTPNISGIYSLLASTKYLNSIGYENIQKHEHEIFNKLWNGLKDCKHIDVYNWDAKSSILTFNVKNVFSQDVANYLGKKNIIVRSGLSCAKILKNILNTDSVIRASFAIYNTEEDIEKFIDAIKNITREKVLNELI